MFRRPDDISVVMAMGDSITAGFLARSPGFFETHRTDETQEPLISVPVAREYRGLSYPIGGDDGAITVPNILGHWSKNLTGMSRGHHPLLACIGGWCAWRYDDGLNAAISGSTSQNLVAQARGWYRHRAAWTRG